ncbi:MAG: hypothetical protein HZA50_16330 [Planctomycetes bacterium]|nr:hypothetical protein [Planctomycetota bacterium]
MFLSLSAAVLAGTALGLALPPSQQNSPAHAMAGGENRSPIIDQAMQLLAQDSPAEDASLRRIEELESQIQADSIRTRRTIEHCRLMAAAAQQWQADSAGLLQPSDEPLLSSPNDLQRLGDYISDIIKRNR